MSSFASKFLGDGQGTLRLATCILYTDMSCLSHDAYEQGKQILLQELSVLLKWPPNHACILFTGWRLSVCLSTVMLIGIIILIERC